MPEWIWSLKDLENVEKNGLRVFSCFSCGGGSTMGYKLSGYEVIGNVEIDPQMMGIYKKNHNPHHPFLMPIQEFKNIPNNKLPPDLFDIDVLDGSPPCSVFSMSGKREDKWGSAHKFREGQAIQHLDDLFFDFLDVVEKLRPSVVIAENVKGLILGNAKGFVKMIFDRFHSLGYSVQLFLLNAATMGVPQKRERVFFIAYRSELEFPRLSLNFNERPILYRDIRSGPGRPLQKDSVTYRRWLRRRPSDSSIGDITERMEGKSKSFNTILVKDNRVPNTLASSSDFIRHDEPVLISEEDIKRIQTFPQDYDFMGGDVKYVCGMSVPPVMMKKISGEVYKQWFSTLQ